MSDSAPARELRPVLIEDIRIVDRHRKSVGDVSELAASIKSIGLLHPIVLTKEYRLIAGERRIEAYKALGHDEIPAVFAADLGEARQYLMAERDENTCRKDFTPSEAVALGKVLEELERPKAAERLRIGQEKGRQNQGKVVSGNFPETTSAIKHAPARDIVGEAVGMSGRTYQKAKAVIDAAENAPEEFGHLVEEMDTTGKVGGAYDKLVAAKKSPPEPKEGERRGKGVILANEAIDCLKRIPKNDALRKRGFQIVADWIRANK